MIGPSTNKIERELFQNIRRASQNTNPWKSPGVQNRVKKDRRLTIMVAVMVMIRTMMNCDHLSIFR